MTTDYLLGNSDNPKLSEGEEEDQLFNDQELERWYKELPKDGEEKIKRLKRIYEAFEEDDD